MNENIYQGQTKLIINMDVEDDITDATFKIQFKKPSGATGSFPGTIIDAVLGTFKYEIANANDLDEFGDWCFWAEVTYSGGKIAYGDPKIIEVFPVGQC